MSFNIKKNRRPKKVVELYKTIDSIHDEKMKYFNELHSVKLPKLKTELKKLPGNIELIRCISSIETDTERNDYFLSVGRILQEYFSINETVTTINVENMTNHSNTSPTKQKLTESYCEILNLPYHKPVVEITILNNYCAVCNIEMIITVERYYTCTSCGIVNSDKLIDGLSYEERCNNNQVFVFDYKRINYFTEWLTQIQANETTEIPHELLEELKIELHKRNILDTSKLTNTKLKKILKEINHSKYYEHIPLIISKLCNSKPLYIPEETCTELKNMFLLIQQPFEKLKGNRKNFLSYPFVLYKFCEILGLHEYLCHFVLLKREKLMKTDVLWKKIVEDVIDTTGDKRWKFIPSC